MLNTLTLLNVTFFMTFGCHTKIHDKGLLTLQEKNLLLTNIDGEIYHVHAGKDKVYLKQLEGCIIYIEGSRLMKHVFVDEWIIQDAGSGSAPFVGPLKREGIQWTLFDHNTKSVLILEDVEKFITPNEHDIVLIGGYVVGPQRLKVISAKILVGEE